MIGVDARRGLDDGTRVGRASEGVQMVAQAVVADGALAVGTDAEERVGTELRGGLMDIAPAAGACAVVRSNRDPEAQSHGGDVVLRVEHGAVGRVDGPQPVV